MTAKLSVSLPDEDAKFIDILAKRHDGNRSAAIQDLVRLGRETESVDEYMAAYAEWEDSGEANAWGGTAADGVSE